MTEDQDLDLVEQLADEFANRLRAGERPSIKEYADRHPELAEIIHDTFEALAMMENMAPGSDDSFGETAGDAASTSLPGLKQLGDYRILREVGRGGMGIVYEAEQLSLGRRVALKVLPQQMLLDKKHKRRFEREAKAAARLHHTNIVPVFGVGEQDGLHYYVMQFIQGLGLDEVIDELRRLKESQHSAQPGSDSDGSARRVARSLMTGQFERTVITGEDSDADEPDVPATAAASRLEVHQSGDGALELSMTAAGLSDSSSKSLSDSFNLSGAIPLSGQSDSSSSTSRARRKQTFWTSVAHIGEQIASALHCAHDQGITHRDIKPSNLLLDMRGTVWVTDFGLAKATDQQDITHTGDILGTLRYMPPEAFEGQSGPSGDLYALGLTLYELLAQKPAFEERDRHKLIKLVTTTEPTRIDKLNRDVPRDLATIVHKAIDRDPSHRYASAREFADDLQRFLDDEPIRARRISTTERIARWSRRNRGLAASLAAVCLLLLVINIAGPVMTYSLVESQSELRATVTELQANKQELEATGRRLEAETVRANDEAADARMQAAENERIAAREADAREEADRQRLLSRRALYSSALFAAQHSISTPEGFAYAQELLDEVRPQAGEEDLRGWEWYYLHAQLLRDGVVLRSFPQHPTSVAYSPDGQLVATSHGSGDVELFNANSGRLSQTLVGHEGIVSWVAWNPDGTRLASSGADKTARIWNVETGTEDLQLRGHTAWVAVVAWSPDGQRLVTGGLDGVIKTWNATSGDNLITIRERSDAIRGVDWSPDGRQIVAGGDEQAVRIWDAETGDSIHMMAGHGGGIARVRFSPDGRRIASASWESAETAVIIWDAELGTELSTLSYQTSGAHDVKWSPDGSRLATAGFDNETVDIWDPDTGERLRSFLGHRTRVLGCSWSPDGHRLVSAGNDQTVRVWDLADEQPIGDGIQAHSLAWSPDGSRIAAASLEHGVKIWDARTRQELLTFSGDRKRIDAVDWNPDGVRLASCGGGQVFHVWEAETGSVLHTINAARNGNIRRVVWSPDGAQVASAADDGTVRIFDAETGDEVQRFGLSTPYGLDWSHDGERLAAAAYSGDVMVWNVETGVELEHLVKPEQAFFEVRFSRDGRLAIAGARKPQQSIFDDSGAGTEGTVIVWDLETGTEQHRLRGHTAMVHSLDWSDDGARLLSAGTDGRLMLWDAATGAQLLVIRDSENQPTISAQFSPDELQIAAGGRAPGIRFWDATAGYAAELSDRLLPSLSEQITANPTFDDLKLRGEIRAGQGHWDEAARDFDRAAALATQGTDDDGQRWFTSPWWVVGPYQEPLDAELPPESNLDPVAPVPGANGSVEEPFHWMATVLGEEQGLNLGRFFHQAEKISGYAQLRVYSPIEQRVAVLFGADDAVRLWFNENLIYSRAVSRTAVRDDEAVDVALQSGWNILLAKVFNSTGDHGLFLRLSDDPVAIARVFARNEKWTEALAWWNRANAERPDDPEVLVGRGRAALGVGETDVADQSFNAALADNESSTVRGVASAYAAHSQSLIGAGRESEATDSLQQARMLYEDLLSEDEATEQDASDLAEVLFLTSRPKWTILEPTEITGGAGEMFAAQRDGSIFVSGPNPERAIYTLTLPLDERPVSAIRLETLPDARLPHGGGGRYPDNGNFHLSEFTVAIVSSGDAGEATSIPIDNALADHSASDRHSPIQAVDGNPRTRWDTDAQYQMSHWAVFTFQSPVQIRDGRLIVTLDSGVTAWGHHGLGRFRLSVTDDPRKFQLDPATFELRDRRFAASRSEDPWVRLGAAYAALGEPSQAAESFARALERAPGISARRELVEQIDQLQTDLSELLALRPNDPPLLMALARQQADAGEAEAALESMERARRLTEALLAESPADESLAVFLADLLLADTTRWTVLEPIEMTSEGGATLTRLDDNSLLAGGPNPDHDRYIVTTAASSLQKITTIRLEALTDDSLPGHGPGRFLPTPGEFVLNRFRVTTASRQNQDSPVEVVLNAAAADYFYPDLPITPEGPWHIGTSGAGRPHVAVYSLAEQVQSAEASPLTFEMTFHNGGEIGLQLGRFRLSVTDDPAAFELRDWQFTLSRIEDPWVRLGAAYTALGDSIQAAEWFVRALERAPGFATRRELVEQIDQLQADLGDLVSLCPDDPLLLNILAQRQWAAGQMDAAAESLTLARRLTEALLSESPDDSALAGFLADLLLSDNTGWTLLEPSEMTSEGGATLSQKADGSILAGGPNANADVYTIRAPVAIPEVCAIRLEALPDPSLPRQGPGRFETGDFHLREFRVFVLSGDDEPADQLPVADAWASYERAVSGNGVHWTIVEGDPRVWYVEGRTGEPHAAVFRLATPLRVQAGQTLIVQCVHANVNYPVNLGRFRLSVSDNPAAFDHDQLRLTARTIEEPWLNLAAAHALKGNREAAADCCMRAIVASTDLAATMDRLIRLSTGILDQVIDPNDVEWLVEEHLARSVPGVRQQVWATRSPAPFSWHLLRDRKVFGEVITWAESNRQRPTFLSVSFRPRSPVTDFVTIWSSDNRNHRLEPSLTRQELDHLLNTLPDDMQIVSLEEYADGGSARNAALWVAQTSLSPWELHERLSAADTTDLAESMPARGFRPTYVNAYPDGTLTTVWVQDGGDSELLLGLTHHDLRTMEREQAAGGLPICIDSHFDGDRRRYCLIIDHSVQDVEWKFTLLVRRSEFQSDFDRNRAAGWMPIVTTESPTDEVLAEFPAHASHVDAPDLPLIPRPRDLTVGQGSLTLTTDSRIVATDPVLTPLAGILSDEIFTVTGVRMLPVEGPARGGDVTLQLDPSLREEAYRIDVEDQAVVRGGNYPAVASATVTLLQALQSDDQGLRLPILTIADQPAYPYRAALIDLARQYHTPGGIEQVIELCRLYKIRYLQLHLCDDQLFMFPSTAFPQAGTTNQELTRFEPPSRPRIEPYSIDELRHLEQFASARGVYLVPELDLPGHSGRLIGDVPDPFGFPGNGSTINIASPTTLAAVETLLNEVMDVFQSTPYVHLGADEVGLGGLEQTPEYKALQDGEDGIKSPHDLYCRFVADLARIVAERGKQAIVWEEAWNLGGAYPLPKDVVVMVWNQGRNPNAIVDSGYPVINATWTPLYIRREDRKSLAFLHPWNVAKFGREGSEQFTTLQNTGRLLGAQLCSWENSECMEIQSMRDRLALVAERTWNPQAGGGLAEFRTRLAHTNAILDRLIHPVAVDVQGELTGDENTFAEPITVTLTPRQEGLTLRYTLDNSLPGPAWQDYTGPIAVDKTVHLRAGLFDANGDLQGNLVGSWFRRIIEVEPNLATHKPVTSGPGPDRDDQWNSRAAVDGRADDAWAHWASTDPAPQWLQIDLEQVCPVDYINVMTFYDGGRYYQLNAEVSVDGKTWAQVLDFSTNEAPATSAGYSGSFAAVDARYVRINMLKNSANPWVHIVEVIVKAGD